MKTSKNRVKKSSGNSNSFFNKSGEKTFFSKSQSPKNQFFSQGMLQKKELKNSLQLKGNWPSEEDMDKRWGPSFRLNVVDSTIIQSLPEVNFIDELTKFLDMPIADIMMQYNGVIGSIRAWKHSGTSNDTGWKNADYVEISPVANKQYIFGYSNPGVQYESKLLMGKTINGDLVAIEMKVYYILVG
ncbi:MAG: hypothetical protein AAFZ15_32470 [Bacteroidota bacterium]